MPHSSGGGHHSGGFHSSSHHHSSGSHSSAPSKPLPRFSRRPFYHSRRYVYYHHGMRVPQYYYYSGEESDRLITSSPAAVRAKCIIVTVFILLFILTSCVGGITAYISDRSLPKKSEIKIYDDVGVLRDKSELLRLMEEFKDITHVVPCIKIVPESRVGYRYTLENYAYNEYVRMFRDEKHWLFVFCLYGDDMDIVSGTWSWEGMIGDDTSFSIGSAMEAYCTDRIQERLTEVGADSFDTALENAFRDMIDYASKPFVSHHIGTILLLLIFFIGLPILILIILIKSIIKNAELRTILAESYPISDDSAECICPICGGKYYSGTVSECPYCNAALTEAFVDKSIL